MKLFTLGALVALGVAAQTPALAQLPAALQGKIEQVRDAIPGQYIVALKPGTSRGGTEQLLRGLGDAVLHRYDTAFTGFAGKLSVAQLSSLLANPNVRYIEQDGRVKLVETQSNPAWGLDRIDQQTLPLDRSFAYPNGGAGVHVYIVDTGVRTTHQEFEGRIGQGANFAGEGGRSPGGGGVVGEVGKIVGGLLGGGGGDDDDTEQPDYSDCNGHGTHVAGSAAGKRYGVAKAATIHPVRVLDCNGSGSMSGVIAGVDWVAKNAEFPAVANLSLGGGASRSLDEAVKNAVDKGIVQVLAAGNEDQDACQSSPARTPEGLTVAASTRQDARASFSNWGRCVDIFAPGTEILSAWHSGDTATKELQGTSMAAPHVAGAVALMLAADKQATPAQIAERLLAAASSGKISDLNGSPNKLLFVSQGEAAEGESASQPKKRGLFY